MQTDEFLVLVETGPVRQSNREDCPAVNSRLSDRRMQWHDDR